MRFREDELARWEPGHDGYGLLYREGDSDRLETWIGFQPTVTEAAQALGIGLETAIRLTLHEDGRVSAVALVGGDSLDDVNEAEVLERAKALEPRLVGLYDWDELPWDEPVESGPGLDAPGLSDGVQAREGDADEFEDELDGELVDPDDPGDLEPPPGLVKRLLADPAHAGETLATQAVERFASRAARDVALIRERNPSATDRQIAVHFKRKYSRASRWEGAATGAPGIFGLPADLILLSGIQSRLVLIIAATYGHDMADHRDRATDLLIIQGVHASREVARRALVDAATKAATKLILRHLRKNALVLIKQLFKVVGFTFTRKALLEKGVPLLSIPISAGVNEASTRILANQAIKYYDTAVTD